MRKLVVIGILCSLLWIIGIFLHIPYLNGTAEFAWPYISGGLTAWAIIPLIIAILAAIVWFYKINKENYWLYIFAALWVLFAVSMVAASPAGLAKMGQIIYSPGSNSYYYVAYTLQDPVKFMEYFPELVDRLPLHAKTHPPGSILYFYTINQFSELLPTQIADLIRSAGLVSKEFSHLNDSQLIGLYLSAFLILIISSFTIIFAYKIAKLLWNQKAAAYAALITASVPSMTLFTPELDQMYAAFALIGFYLFIKYKNYLADMLNGMLIAFFTFFTLPIAAITGVLGMYDLISKKNLKLTCKRLALVGIGFFVFFSILFVLFKYSHFEAFIVSLKNNPQFYAVNIREPLGRSYFTWLFFNPYEFIVFSIFPFICFLILNIRKDKFSWAWLTVLFLLLLSGIFRGEVARTWLFMMPFATLSAANSIISYNKKELLILVGMNLLIIFTAAYSLDLVNPAFQFIN